MFSLSDRALGDARLCLAFVRPSDLPPPDGPTLLVTGSSGRLGSLVAARLPRAFRRGLDVRPGPATTTVGDLGESRAVAEALRGVDTVLHLAGLHAPHLGRERDGAFVAVNVKGTERLLEAARRGGLRRFVFVSSMSVYGHAAEAGDRAVLVNELLEPQPRDIYDATKLEAERLVLAADGDFPEGTIVLRVGRCFPEPPRLRAWHRFYRGLAAADAARAVHRSALSDAGGIYNIVARTRLTEADGPRLKVDPLGVLRLRYPHLTIRDEDWRDLAECGIDRIYDGSKALRRFGFASRYDSVAMDDRAGRLKRQAGLV